MPAELWPTEDCASNFGVFEVPSRSDPAKIRRVRLGGESFASCPCEAFTYFKGPEEDRTCWHISYAYEHGCLWNPQYRDGRLKDPPLTPVGYTSTHFTGGKCPACGGPMIAVMRAI